MPDTFTLEIALGNDSMGSAEDVARALRTAAEYIDGIGGWEHPDGCRRGILDINGNTVGQWEAK